MIQVLPTIAHMGDVVSFRFWNSETSQWVDLTAHLSRDNPGVSMGTSEDDYITRRTAAEMAEILTKFIKES